MRRASAAPDGTSPSTYALPDNLAHRDAERVGSARLIRSTRPSEKREDPLTGRVAALTGGRHGITRGAPLAPIAGGGSGRAARGRCRTRTGPGRGRPPSGAFRPEPGHGAAGAEPPRPVPAAVPPTARLRAAPVGGGYAGAWGDRGRGGHPGRRPDQCPRRVRPGIAGDDGHPPCRAPS